MKIGDTGARFLETLQIVGGPRFQGSIHRIGEARQLAYPYRLLRVRPTSPVKIGDVIVHKGRTFCCAEHFERAEEKSLKLFEVDHRGVWQRELSKTDAVTGLEKFASKKNLGAIYYQIVPESQIKDPIRIPETKYRILTPTAVLPGDYVDALVVLHVDKELGVYIGEVK